MASGKRKKAKRQAGAQPARQRSSHGPRRPADRSTDEAVADQAIIQGLPPEAARRLREQHPDLVRRLAQGMTQAELAQMMPEITAAMAEAGADPGKYSFALGPPDKAGRKVRANLVTGGHREDDEPGLPYGLQPGDMIAAEQPLGFTETGIELPSGGEIPAGSKVYRAQPGDRPGALIPHEFSGAANQAFIQSGGGTGDPAPPTLPPDVTRRIEAAVAGRAGDGPSIIITDDRQAALEAGADLMIEDLDPDPDAGRVLMGRPEAIRAYHEREAELNKRAARFMARGRKDQQPMSQGTAEAIRLQQNWTSDSVLDQLTWLAHHYRHPHADLADYLAFFIRDSQQQDSRATQHFWPVDLSGGPADLPQGREIGALIARGLADADAYQVTAGMCLLMRNTWETHRENMLHRLSEGELTAPAGFAWLDAPWLIRLSAGEWIPVRAISWEKMVRPVRGEDGRTAWVDCVRITQWLLIADDVAFRRWDDDRSRADRVISQIGRLIPHSMEILPFDRELSFTPKFRHQAEASIGLLHILWMYLGMELPKTRPVHASAPAVRKRAARSLRHDRITIIPLRKYAYIEDPAPRFPRMVAWTCRWWVEQFYRHIDPYDDADADGRRRKHKATPAGRTGHVIDDKHDICAVCLANGQTVRITEVHGFFKGPSGKPIRTPAKGRTLQRLSR